VSERRAQDVLDYWFGADPLAPDQIPLRMRMWFGGDEPAEIRAVRDESLAERFGPLVRAAAARELDAWASSPHRLLALVLLLDQFPRNIYRGSAQAFAQDARALELVMAGLQTGADATLAPIERLFLYMPLQHAESVAVQDESIAAFRRLVGDAPAAQQALFNGCLQYAVEHRDLIVRFGRFPHRNAVLGRASTAEEIQFLQDGGSHFGQ
jgi:uncharacterized protein (DUF924 family)